MAKDNEELRNCYIKTLELQNELYKRDHIVLKIEHDFEQIKKENETVIEANEKFVQEVSTINQRITEKEDVINELKQQLAEQDVIRKGLNAKLVQQETIQMGLNERLKLTNSQLNEKDEQIKDYWERIQSMRIKSRIRRAFGLKN